MKRFCNKQLCISDTQSLVRTCNSKQSRAIASADKCARVNNRSCTNFFQAETANYAVYPLEYEDSEFLNVNE